MITITFEPYEGYLTEEEYLQIMDLLNSIGSEVKIEEGK